MRSAEATAYQAANAAAAPSSLAHAGAPPQGCCCCCAPLLLAAALLAEQTTSGAALLLPVLLLLIVQLGCWWQGWGGTQRPLRSCRGPGSPRTRTPPLQRPGRSCRPACMVAPCDYNKRWGRALLQLTP